MARRDLNWTAMRSAKKEKEAKKSEQKTKKGNHLVGREKVASLWLGDKRSQVRRSLAR